jgi:hypothetical protein
MTNKNKINNLTLKISFLMQHQNILPDLQEIIEELDPGDDEYLKGAKDALLNLILHLARKG